MSLSSIRFGLCLAAVAIATAACGQPPATAAPLRASGGTSPCPAAAYGKPCPLPVVVTPSPTPGTIAYLQPSSVSFIDADQGWAVGLACDARGSCRPGVAHSADGGATWTELPAPAPRATDSPEFPWPSRSHIVFTSAREGWLFNPLLASTVDGGLSWKMVDFPTPHHVIDVASFAGMTWAITTCDAPCGATVWRAASRQGPFTAVVTPLIGVPGLGTEVAPVVANGRLILYGTRGGDLAATADGRSWTRIASPCPGTQLLGASPAGLLMDVCASLVGGGLAPKEAWVSNDGGAHWTLRSRSSDPSSGTKAVGNIPATGYPNSLAMPTAIDAWMAMGREDLYESHDGGINWTPSAVAGQFGGNAGGSERVTFVDARHGWALGAASLVRTTDGRRWTTAPILGPVPGYPAG